MVFSSLIFLWFFLPVFLCAYVATPPKHRNIILFLASVVFYGWWRIDFALLLISVLLFTYGIGLEIRSSPNRQRFWLWNGIFGNLAVLAFFKYADFGIQSFNRLLSGLHMSSFEALHIVLPIGISFYVFHCISYLVDLYRKDAEPAANFWQFASFAAMFPHLVAGPVLKFKDMAGQMRHPDPSWDNFNMGCLRFMNGFCEKILVADSIAPLVNTIFDLPDPSMSEAWLGALAYGIQLYFDFAGYTDMAIGLALMIGFRFNENFNQPYASRSVTDFWQRWHISLSHWLRDYVYIPLGGNRLGLRRTCLNIFIVMSLCGLWHGASWNFVLWGMLHGMAMILNRALPLKLSPILSTALTLIFVTSSWVLFRADTLTQASEFYNAMLGQNSLGFGEALYWQIRWLSIVALTVGCYLALLRPYIPYPKPSMPTIITALFIVALIKLIAQTYTPFLYFQF